MKYELKLLPIVYLDLKKAKKWYSEINADLGDDFKLKVSKEFDYIKKHPKHYQKRHEDLRLALVERFPYVIYYLIEEDLKQVLIVGVLAQKQSFKRISKRLKTK